MSNWIKSKGQIPEKLKDFEWKDAPAPTESRNMKYKMIKVSLIL